MTTIDDYWARHAPAVQQKASAETAQGLGHGSRPRQQRARQALRSPRAQGAAPTQVPAPVPFPAVPTGPGQRDPFGLPLPLPQGHPAELGGGFDQANALRQQQLSRMTGGLSGLDILRSVNPGYEMPDPMEWAVQQLAGAGEAAGGAPEEQMLEDLRRRRGYFGRS